MAHRLSLFHFVKSRKPLEQTKVFGYACTVLLHVYALGYALCFCLFSIRCIYNLCALNAEIVFSGAGSN